jgi:uncharacterized membrane protein YjgN (DUF898 family)
MLTAPQASAAVPAETSGWFVWQSRATPQRATAETSAARANLVFPGGTEQPLIAFVEPEESFLSLAIRNFGLTLATLGFYSFWARAEARRQLHRSIRIGGQPLDYTGTGREACVAFLIGTLTTVVIVSTFLFFFNQHGTAAKHMQMAMNDFRLRRLLITLPLIFLLGSVVYRKRKHILRRTWWRGQHFDLDGQPWAYAVQHLWTAFLVPLTLGWAGPWRASRLERRKINDMHIGTQRFSTAVELAPLYRAFAALWFGGGAMYVATMGLIGITIGTPVLDALQTQTLAPLLQPGVLSTGAVVLSIGLTPVIGFILYYRAAWLEHQISSLVFDGMRLKIRLPKMRFAALMLWSSFAKIISFGAFQPVTDAMLVRFVISRITTEPWLKPKH